jgi:hypothetical protein
MGRIQLPAVALALAVAACGGGDRPSPACGIAALTGPLVALEGFARGDGLAVAPTVPDTLPGRFVAGPVTRVLVSRNDSARLVASVEGTVPEQARPGYGVLLVDQADGPMGILVFDGQPVRGAISLGTIDVGDTILPLYGLRVAAAAIEDPRCPLFGPE